MSKVAVIYWRNGKHGGHGESSGRRRRSLPQVDVLTCEEVTSVELMTPWRWAAPPWERKSWRMVIPSCWRSSLLPGKRIVLFGSYD